MKPFIIIKITYLGKDCKESLKKIMKRCSKCNNILNLNNFNKDKSTKDGFQNKCKKCKNIYYKKYKLKLQEEYIINRNDKLKYQNNYYKINKGDRVLYQINYINNRKQWDDLFKLLINLRSRTYSAFKNKNYYKKQTKELLGAELNIVKIFIEDKFIENMSWKNYGTWHIDHIIPLSSAKTEEQLIKLCHYTNLQPLWAIDNLKKGSKLY